MTLLKFKLRRTLLVVTTNDIKFKINKVSSSELFNFHSGSGTNTTKIKNQLFREQLKVFPSKQCILIWKVVKLSLKCHFNRQMIAPSKLIPKIYCFHTFFLNKGDNLLLPVWKMLLPIIFEYLLDTDSKNIWFYIILY